MCRDDAVLVGVDADREATRFCRGLQDTQPGLARDVADDVGAVAEQLLRHPLAVRGVAEAEAQVRRRHAAALAGGEHALLEP